MDGISDVVGCQTTHGRGGSLRWHRSEWDKSDCIRSGVDCELEARVCLDDGVE